MGADHQMHPNGPCESEGQTRGSSAQRAALLCGTMAAAPNGEGGADNPNASSAPGKVAWKDARFPPAIEAVRAAVGLSPTASREDDAMIGMMLDRCAHCQWPMRQPTLATRHSRIALLAPLRALRDFTCRLPHDKFSEPHARCAGSPGTIRRWRRCTRHPSPSARGSGSRR